MKPKTKPTEHAKPMEYTLRPVPGIIVLPKMNDAFAKIRESAKHTDGHDRIFRGAVGVGRWGGI